jgi:tetratricopeptide (TPR) repeat protein
VLTNLRELVDLQQYKQLNQQTKEIWQESKDISIAPILAISYAHLKEYQKAFEICAICEEKKNQLDIDAKADLAGAYCLLWQIDKAKDILEDIVEQKSDHSLALARLAWVRWQDDEIEEAVTLYKRSISLNPNRLPIWSGLTHLYIIEKEPKLAKESLQNSLKHLEKLQDSMPKESVEAFLAEFERLKLSIWVLSDDMSEANEWLIEQEALDDEQWSKKICLYSTILAHYNRHDIADQILHEALKRAPKDIDILLQLVSLASIQGHSAQEIALLKRVIKISQDEDKPTYMLWRQMANATMHNNTNQALKYVQKAQKLLDEQEPTDEIPASMLEQQKLHIQTTLASVKNQLKEYKEAENLYRDVLEKNPYLTPALQGLGSQLMQMGAIDEAVELYERLKQIDPLQGVSALINARKFPEDRETLKKMEKMANRPSLEGEIRSGILFQLASAYEKIKEYDKAFEVLERANKSTAIHLKYSPQKHRQESARVRYAFGKELYKHRPNYGLDTTIPVYVVGMPRSGTTLVEQIIASHSEIFGAGELGVIPTRVQGLNRWERHVGSGRAYPDVVDDMSEYVTKGIAQGVIDELKELAHEDKPNAKHIVDKLPHNFENIGFIKFLFPNAKIISVRRDPRDIAVSNYFQNFQAKHGGMGFAYDLEWIGEQLADHNLYMHHWKNTFDDILEINYEDVVANLEGSARAMLEYIGVEWEDSVLEYNKLDRAVKTASVWQVRQPIYKSAVEKWRRYEKYLAPLIKGTNKKIEWEPIEMISLPEAGLVQQASDLYNQGDLNGAELNCKKMLHHNPNHAAAHYILGLVYLSKNYLDYGIEEIEKAIEIAPWHKDWKKTLEEANMKKSLSNIS